MLETVKGWITGTRVEGKLLPAGFLPPVLFFRVTIDFSTGLLIRNFCPVTLIKINPLALTDAGCYGQVGSRFVFNIDP